MAESTSRFTAQNKTTHERLSTNTVGLVALSDFRKRRAEVLEQQEKEARDALSATNTPPDRSLTGTPNNVSDASEAEKQAKKKKKRLKAAVGGNKLSFGGNDDEEEGGEGEDVAAGPVVKKGKAKAKSPAGAGGDDEEQAGRSRERSKTPSGKIVANTSVGFVPRSFTKSGLRKEAAEREALRKEFLQLQTVVRATEIAIPFVFYDGTNIPGGIARVKKGDFAWVFLDKSRKLGADLGVGGDKNTNVRREWARVGVDDLMLVRGTIIIPHHYEFYFFIMNKSIGPGGRRLFDYSADAPITTKEMADDDDQDESEGYYLNDPRKLDVRALEGASDDPTFTKVVDRRWYQRNKHIYPASVWQEFDPEKDYHNQIRRDPGGNALFVQG